MLAENPTAGRARPELHPEIRSFPVGNYIVFYRIIPGAVDVVRVLSRFRDINQAYFEE
jgi:toxin ParE1/3/4